jgi:transposase
MENQVKPAIMRTLEFRINPTLEQEQKLNDWLLILRWTWNRALGLMQEFTQYNPYCKSDKCTYPAMPLLEWDHKDKCCKRVEIAEWKHDIELVEEKKGLVYPVQISPDIPALTQLPTSKKSNQLIKIFGHRYHKDREISYKELGERKLKYADCPFKFLQGKLTDLAGTWIEFTKRPNEVKPARFKSSKNPITTLIHYNAEQINFDWEQETFTPHRSIGKIQIVGLKKRLPMKVSFNPLKICKKASGWFIQVTISQEQSVTKLTGLTTGIDLGKLNLFALDKGYGKEPSRPYLRSQKKLNRLQKRMSRKGRINNANFKKGDEWIKSNNWLKDKDKLAKLHEKNARNRRAFNHHFSTLLTDWFDLIFLGEGYKPRLAKAKKQAIKNDEGEVTGFAKNGQAQRRGANKATGDIASGQFIEMIKSKAKEKSKCVIMVNEDYTSQLCPSCGKIKKKSLSNRTHSCSNCGFKIDRDICSGINIKLKGIATLLNIKKSELLKIENLEKIISGNIIDFLLQEQNKIFCEYPAITINHWLEFLEIGSTSYKERNTIKCDSADLL